MMRPVRFVLAVASVAVLLGGCCGANPSQKDGRREDPTRPSQCHGVEFYTDRVAEGFNLDGSH